MPSRHGTRMILLEARLSWSMLASALMLSGSFMMELLKRLRSVSDVRRPNLIQCYKNAACDEEEEGGGGEGGRTTQAARGRSCS
jgi:hypothetical protein